MELQEGRFFAGRMDRSLDVIELEAIEGTLTRLQVEIAQPAEGPPELEPVLGVVLIGNALEHLRPSGVRRIGSPWRGAYRLACQRVVRATVCERGRRED